MRQAAHIFTAGLLVACCLAACTLPPPNPAPEAAVASPGVRAMETTAAGARFTTGPLPAGWSVFPHGDAARAFRNDANDQIIMVNVLYAPNRTAGLIALRNHLLFDIAERKISEQDTIEVDLREALWTVVAGRLDGAEVKMAIVVVRIDAWVYDLILVGDPDHFDVALPDFKHFIDAFHQQRAGEPQE